MIAVSPIIGGRALKGPAAKMMAELGQPVNALSVAEYYREFVDSFVVDRVDSQMCTRIEALGIRTVAASTVMRSLADKVSLAHRVIETLEES